MNPDLGTQAIRSLQQAYGFRTDTPLWDSKKLFELLTAAYPGLTEIHCPKRTQIKHVMNSWRLGGITISAGSHSETYAKASSTQANTLTIQYAGMTTYTQDGMVMTNRPMKNAMVLVDAPGSAMTEEVSCSSSSYLGSA